MADLMLTDNDKNILKTIRQNPGKTQSYIADLSDIKAWSTAKGYIDGLFEKNMIVDKKALKINGKFAYFIGVCVGKSDIRVCVMNFAFKLLSGKDLLDLLDEDSNFKKHDGGFWKENGFCCIPGEGKNGGGSAPGENDTIWCAPTPSDDFSKIRKILNDLCGLALELNKKISVLSVSFAFGDHVDHENSIVVKSNILKSRTLDNIGTSVLFTDETRSRMAKNEIGICFEQNAKASLIGERSVGCLAGSQEKNENGLVLYLGQGLGAAFWLDGHLYRGRRNAAGAQFGHLKVSYGQPSGRDEEKCACGEYGCLEQKIRALFPDKEFVKQHSGAELAQWLDKEENEKSKERLVEYLARAVFNVCGLLEIDCLVFSGKLGNMYKSIERLFQNKMIECNRANLRVHASKLAENSAAVGAAICGYNKWIGETVE